jgi:hypothetical protein
MYRTVSYNINGESVKSVFSMLIYHEWGRRGMHIGYWWESQKVRDHWEDQDVGGRTILKWILEREWIGWYGLD